jgi:uncharacterized protein
VADELDVGRRRSDCDVPNVAAMATSDPSPRVEIIDALRGFALLGIVLVNVGYFASAWHGLGLPDPAAQGPIDGPVAFLVKALAETKIYLLFSLLFGYSLTIQMHSAQRAGRALVPAFSRRLLALFVLGAAHAVLLFNGDILATYALMGAVLLMLRNRSARAAAQIAAAILVALAAAFALLSLVAPATDPAAVAASARELQHGFRGSPADVIDTRLAVLPYTLQEVLLPFQAPSALALFLLGLAAGKLRLLHHAAEHRALWRRLRLGGLLVGVPGGLLYAWGSADRLEHPSRALLVDAADVLLAPTLAAGLTASAILILLSPRGRALRQWLAPAGRMALTSYLTQSLVLAFVFTGYGAGLVGRVGAGAATAIAFALFVVQLALSRWWLAGHRYGPVEWLLRWVTTLQRPPLRKEPRHARTGAARLPFQAAADGNDPH